MGSGGPEVWLLGELLLEIVVWVILAVAAVLLMGRFGGG
jgi:hypothetical protein